MAFVSATASMFTPDELFETLGIPFAETVDVAQPVDILNHIVFSKVTPDDVSIAACCQHGHVIEATLPGRELAHVLVVELGVTPDVAVTITRALYWLPSGTVFSISHEHMLVEID
jgi:hypothetical protein